MRYLSTITPPDMRNINCTSILELVRWEGPVSRSYISRKLNISLPSVMRIIDDLVEAGLLQLVESHEKSGRQRPYIKMNTEGNITIGLDLGGGKIYGAVTDLGGKVLFDRMIMNHGSKGDEVFELMIPVIEELLKYAKETGKTIRGLGVGVPGIALHKEGIVRRSPSLEWRDYPLKDKLMTKFNLPIFVDNDVNMSALGESWFGCGQNFMDMAYIRIGTGLGMGIIMDGTLYRGVHEAAGEIRHLLPGRDELDNNYPEFSSLEYLVGGVGLARQAKEALEGNITKREWDKIDGEYVMKAYENKKKWSVPIIEKFIDYLAMTIIAVNAMFDPRVIVIGGGISRSADLFIDSVREKVKGKFVVDPDIKVSDISARASVLGVMINILHNTSNYYLVKKLS